jgi:S1-C subfamily serine protease
VAAVAAFVIKPKLTRSTPEETDTGQSTEELVASITKNEQRIEQATEKAAQEHETRNQHIKAQNSAEAVEALRIAKAQTAAARSLLAESYAQEWFEGDRNVGAAMVDVRIKLLQKEIDAHHDTIQGNEWMFQLGDQVSFDRLWPVMLDDPRLAQWMAERQIQVQVDFMWHLLIRSNLTKRAQTLPPDVAGLRPDGTGSGFWVSPDGHLITNQHVVAGAQSIQLRLASRAVVPAVRVREDPKRDLALLKADVASPEWLALSTGPARQGVEVFTQGFPNPTVQGLAAKYSDGKISSLSGINDDETYYQISVPIQPGNSGGALIHASDGLPWVVGVISGKLIGGENVNYAIKSTVVCSFLSEFPEGQALLARAKPARPADPPVEHARKASCLVLVKLR